MIRKIGKDKTQILHRMRLGTFTPREPISSVQNTSQERKPDAAVLIKYDDFYGRAWESNSDKPFCDNDQDESSLPNTRGVTLDSVLRTPELVAHQEPNEEVPQGIFLNRRNV